MPDFSTYGWCSLRGEGHSVLINNLDFNVQNKNNSLQSKWFQLDDYKFPLRMALINSNYYNDVPLNPRYILYANLIRLDEPRKGFKSTVNIEAEYILKEINSNREVFNQVIESSHTIAMKEPPKELAIASYKPQQFELVIEATEIAVEKNIYQLLVELSELEIE